MSKVAIIRIFIPCVFVVSGVMGMVAYNSDSVEAKEHQFQPTQTQPSAMKTNIPSQIASANHKTNHIIEIRKMEFQMKSLNVKIGDTVTWVNKDLVAHTVTANDKSWNSGRIRKGESFSLTITAQTNLGYFCLYHRQMKAKLVLSTAS